MIKIIFSLFLVVVFLEGKVTDREIANMFMLGFYGTVAGSNTEIHKDICNMGLGGVILFDRSPIDKSKYKNIINRNQLIKLNSDIKKCGTKPFIAVDQEGGLVQRIKFNRIYPQASLVSKRGEDYAKKIYSQMASELHYLGFNLNFAPVVDLALNPKNKVIVKYGRSFSNDPNRVIDYASIFLNEMKSNGIALTLKHFPGHGSSLGDTHKGFVDVTKLWNKIELIPYQKLSAQAEVVMKAHIYNSNIDPDYPASLSKKTVDKLRNIGFQGVIVSDDLQMGAIAKYNLKERIKLSINAGIDVMLFANQVHPEKVIKINKLVNIVRLLLKNNKISETSIKNANKNINKLKNSLYYHNKLILY